MGSRSTWRPISLSDGVADGSRGGNARWLAHPLRAFGTGVGGVDLDPADVDPRAIAHGLQLVVQESGVALASVVVEPGGFRQGLADPHQHSPIDLSVGPDLVDDDPRVVSGRELEDADDPGSPVELDPGGVGDELGRQKGLLSEPAGTSRGVDLRSFGHITGSLCQEWPPRLRPGGRSLPPCPASP